jgi:poly(A) polymerase
MVYDIAMRLKFSVDERNAVTAAVRNHMRMAHVREMKSAKLKRWMCDENFPLELELHRLDCISSHKFMECWLFLIDRLAETPVEVLRMKPLVNGSDLIKLGATPSPLFKSILDALFDRQLTGEFSGKEEALRAAKQMLEQKK